MGFAERERMRDLEEQAEERDRDKVRRLRDEVARLKEKTNDPKAIAFNDLYYIVTREYENWDEGMTVDWEAVQHACSLMVSAIRRGQKEY